MMKCAICDDQKSEREKIIKFVRQFERKYNLACSTEEFEDAESFLRRVDNSTAYDVVFMDIYMAKLNGFQAAKIIYDNGFTGSIIFTTNSRDFAIESYSIEASGYLVKPCTYEAFEKTMERAKKHWMKSKKTLQFPSSHLELSVYYKDIQWIETNGKGCFLHVKNECIPSSISIGKLEDILCLEDNFFRVGKSYILNQNYITDYDSETISLKDNTKVLMPVRDRLKIKKLINDYRFLHM